MIECELGSTEVKNIFRTERFFAPALDAPPVAEYFATIKQRAPNAKFMVSECQTAQPI
jgi:hypothetical protein